MHAFSRLWLWTGLCLVYALCCTQPHLIALIWTAGALGWWWREVL